MKKQNDLLRRGGFTIILLLIYIIGQNIPLPFFKIIAKSTQDNTIEHILALTTGGTFSNSNLFAIGMAPYMFITIFMSVFTAMNREWAKRISRDLRGKLQISGIFIFACLQAIVMAVSFYSNRQLFDQGTANANLVILATGVFLVAGALLIAWIASMNVVFGVGGPFVMILPGIVTSISKSLLQFYPALESHLFRAIMLVALTILFIFVTERLYTAEYRIDIQRPILITQSVRPFLAFRILIAGTFPLMFASTLMTLPNRLFNLLRINSTFLRMLFNLDTIPGTIMYAVVLYALGVLFSFINLMPIQIAEDMQEQSDYIIGVKPGTATKKYLVRRVSLWAIIGSLYLVLVTVTPLMIGHITHKEIYTNLSTYFAMWFVMIAIFDNVRQDLDFLYYKDNYQLFANGGKSV